MPELLRQYEDWECGEDGYPEAWHGKCVYAVIDATLYGEAHVPGNCCPEIAIKDLIRREAQERCERCWHPYTKGSGEWSPCDQSCKHAGEQRWRFGDTGQWMYTKSGTPGVDIAWAEPLVVEARYRILTVHHLDEDKANCRWWNLVALCQRCHLRMQRKVVMDRPYLYEHSEWFKPYAAAFYAFKYLGEDLSREEVMARLEELLKLEHRFDQGVLL